MKKIITIMMLASAAYQLDAITSVMNHRITASSPLLYKVMDYSEKQLSIEFEPWVAGMFNPEHTMANLSPNGTSNISLNQNGNGDINPEWILLAANNDIGDYQSTVNLTPELSMYGLLFHCYKQFEYFYFDIKTALLQCKTNIKLSESGGGNGGMAPDFPNMNNEIIYNAQDAFSQADWNYGKIGQSNNLIGFDNIQLTFGSTADMHSFSSESTRSYFSGFAIIEVPTGPGTKAEWLFEPQIGTNHWAFGFGTDVLVESDNGFSLVAGGNFRHFIGGWETRSFDLTRNGPWSRYLGTDIISVAQDALPTVGTPGINLFTQDALIQGRNQITLYARLQKRWEGCLFEVSYNYMHQEGETISQVTSIPQGYGIFDMNATLGGAGITSSSATISQGVNDVVPDLNPVELVTSDLNLASGAMGAWNSNMITARLQRVQENYTYGVGASADLAHSAQAISSWSVWANFEILL